MCAGLIVIAYFLPWLDIMFASMSGFAFGKMVLTEAGKSGGPGWGYATLFFVIFGIASAAINNKKGHFLSGLYVLLVMLWMLSDVISGSGSMGGMISPFKLIGIGIWITVLASIGQIIGAFRLEASVEDEPQADRFVEIRRADGLEASVEDEPQAESGE